jgi:hypothetical protein
MRRLLANSTSVRLFSTAGTWGEAQLVSTSASIVFDLQSRVYDTAGHLHREHALANLSVATAIRLRQLFGEAIEASLDASAARTQPGLWSDATVASIASGWGRRS